METLNFHLLHRMFGLSRRKKKQTCCGSCRLASAAKLRSRVAGGSDGSINSSPAKMIDWGLRYLESELGLSPFHLLATVFQGLCLGSFRSFLGSSETSRTCVIFLRELRDLDMSSNGLFVEGGVVITESSTHLFHFLPQYTDFALILEPRILFFLESLLHRFLLAVHLRATVNRNFQRCRSMMVIPRP